MKRFIFISVFLIGMFQIQAQDGQDEWGNWFMYFGKNRVSDKVSIHTEVQYRLFEVTSNFNQLLLRTGVNYDLSENAMVTLGYGFILTDPTFVNDPGETDSSENRIFQQFVLRNKVGKFSFSHRYRLEQRFLNVPGVGTDTQHRARYFLRITYPLSEDWFLTAYEEIFINLQEPIFGQNRLYGAVGYKVNKDLSFQFGYLKNHFTGANFDRLQFSIWWNTDLRKKQENVTL